MLTAWRATVAGLVLVLFAGGIGFPFPEDLTLVGAGALAHQHVLRLTDVLVAGFAGVMAADWTLYLVGRRYGAEMIGHPRLARLVGASRIHTVREVVIRHGVRAVFLARFVLGTRIITFVGAGTFGVPAARFAIAEAAGTAIFVPATTTLGFLFADQAMRIAHDVGRAQHWLVLGGLAGLALYLALRAWATRLPPAGSEALTPGAPPRDTEAPPPARPPQSRPPL
jgi:membrane protein DedA with SNARE-associated domain